MFVRSSLTIVKKFLYLSKRHRRERYFTLEFAELDDIIIRRLMLDLIDGENVNITARSQMDIFIDFDSHPKSRSTIFYILSKFFDVNNFAFVHMKIVTELFSQILAFFSFLLPMKVGLRLQCCFVRRSKRLARNFSKLMLLI